MRILYSTILAIATATAANAAQETHDPNLLVSDDLESKSEVYSWVRPIDEVAMNTPYLGFFVEKRRGEKPFKPTVVVNTKTTQGLRPECQQPRWIVDGTPMEPTGYQKVTAKMPDQGVLDILHTEFPLDSLRQMAIARDVKYMLCESAYKMNATETEGLVGVLDLYDGKIFIPDHPPHD